MLSLRFSYDGTHKNLSILNIVYAGSINFTRAGSLLFGWLLWIWSSLHPPYKATETRIIFNTFST